MLNKILKFFTVFSAVFVAAFFLTILIQYAANYAGVESLPGRPLSVASTTPSLSPGTAAKLTPLSSTSSVSATTTKQSNSKSATLAPKKIVATKKPTTSSKVSMPGALVVAKPAPTPVPPAPTPTSTPTQPTSPDAGTPNNEGALNQEDIFVIVNKERAAAGLPLLTFNKRLSAIAEIKAVDMINKQYFAHIAPDGTDIAALAIRYGYPYLNIGENLAMGDFVTSAEVMDGWMHSPGHRANILNKSYTEIGISAVEGYYEGHYIWFAVQEFGRPMDACQKVDTALKVTIDAEEATLNQEEAQLATYKSQLERGGSDEDTYNAIVAKYNALVDEYNALIGKTKQDVEVYNQQVNAFNACVGG